MTKNHFSNYQNSFFFNTRKMLTLFFALFLFTNNAFSFLPEEETEDGCVPPSSYYATNPADQKGIAGTIIIDGVISDWSESMLVCQGVANDDPRIFKGSHEGPVYDLYALYAAWDANNLYLMWQYCNVTDVADSSQGFPISDNGKPWNGDLPIAIALDVDPILETDGIIDSTMNSVWHNDNFINYQNGMDHLLMFSTKPGVGVPALFKMNANGAFDYNPVNVTGFTEAGIEYLYGDAVLSSTLYGINSNGYSGYTPADLTNEALYVDFNTLGHDSAQETFYEMKIPLAALGIDLNYLETNGIGAMIVSTFGTSAIESLPHDDATLDNALISYGPDASTSHEKEDLDIFTEPMARIGVDGPGVDSVILAFSSAATLRCIETNFPIATVYYDNGLVETKTLSWSPAPDFYTVGTVTYTSTVTGYAPTITFTLTVNPNDDCTPPPTGCEYFTWDNATVYFALVDRFYDGNPSNNNSYGRVSNPVGGFHGGDFAGLTQKINEGYFNDLGVDAIWFTAPYEQVHSYGDVDPAPYNGFDRHYAFHGYYPYDWTEMDANYGTATEFEAFCDAAHEHGIRLVMDIVMNHAGYGWDLGDNPNWCNDWWVSNVSWVRAGNDDNDYCSPTCASNDETMCLAGLPDIRTEYSGDVGVPNILLKKWDSTKEAIEQQELDDFFNATNLSRTPRNHLIKWLTDWVREYGIDAFRIDTYKHVEREAWGALKMQADAALSEYRANNLGKPLANRTEPFWMVGEHYGHGPNKNNEAVNVGKTDALINFNFKNVAGNPLGIEGTYSYYANIFNNDPDWTALSYISSHDDCLFDRNDLYDGATSLLLAPGPVQIFYGDETKRPFIEDPNGHQPGTSYYEMNFRSFMNWGSIDNNLLAHWQKLGKFRKKHPSIGAGSHTQLSASPYVFHRVYNTADKQDEVIVGLGLGSGSKTITVSSAFADGDVVTNAYTGDVATVSSGNVIFNVGVEGLILLEIACDIAVIDSATLAFNTASTPACVPTAFPTATVVYNDGSTAIKTPSWSPTPDFDTEGITTYTGTIDGYASTLTFTLTVTPSSECDPPNPCEYFTWDNATVYFALVDRFYDGNSSNNNSYGRVSNPVGGFLGGDFAGLTQKINAGYFNDLGVDAIWFTAPYEQVHAYGEVNPAPFSGFDRHYAFHGYYPYDWTEMDANYGTATEFEAFCDAAHEHGIRLVMDIVMNHAGYGWDLGNNPNWCNDWWVDGSQIPWVRAGDSDSDYCSTACGNNNETMCLAGLPDIRTEYSGTVGLPNILLNKWDAGKEATEQQELTDFFNATNLQRTPRNHLIKWMTDWVREYGIDAFRIDTYKHVERQAWGELKIQADAALAEYRANNPTKPLADRTEPFWMVGEDYGHGPDKNNDAVNTGKTDALINFDFKNVAGNPLGIEGTYSYYANIFNNDPDWTALSYISSHDDQLFDRNDLYDGATSLLLSPGPVQIYYGDETKRPFIEDPNGHPQGSSYYEMNFRSFMNWGSIDNNLLTHWQKLGQFRKRHPSIGAGSHAQLSGSPYIFHRVYNTADKQDEVIVGLGLGSGSKTITVSSAFADGDVVTNAYTGDVATVSSGNVTFNVGVEGLVLLEVPCDSTTVGPGAYVNPPSGNYDAPVTVILSASNNSAAIYYTINGGTPILYTGSFTVDSTMAVNDLVTVCATATEDGSTSPEVCETYNFGDTPIITLRVKNDACGGTIYAHVYDVNGEANTDVAPWPGVPMTPDPCNPGWFTYSIEAENFMLVLNCDGTAQTDDLSITGDMCWNGNFGTTTAWGACPSTGLAVDIAPAGGNHVSGTSVPIFLTPCPESASVYYTINGGTPIAYSTSFSIDDSMGTAVTVCATATKEGVTSPEVCETYNFTPGITLTVKNDACNGTMYVFVYDVNGVPNTDVAPWPGIPLTPDPLNPGWATYSIDADNAMIVLNCDGAPQTQDLFVDQSMCWDGSFNLDEIFWTTCSAVTIYPGGCNFPGGLVNVTLNPFNATEVYYTTNGTTPSSNNGILYDGSFNITGTSSEAVTVNAIAYDGNGAASVVATKTFTFFDSISIYWDAAGCDMPTLHYFYAGFSTDWPGMNMIHTGVGDWYKWTIHGTDCANLVISCNGANQTGDLMGICEDRCWQNGQWVNCPLPMIDTTRVDTVESCPEMLDEPGTITTGTYQAWDRVISNGVVMATENVSYKAGNYIDLNAGFEVKLGAAFEAVIAACPETFAPLSDTESRLSVYKKRIAEEDSKVIPNGFEILEKQEKSIRILIEVNDDFILQNKRLIIGNRIIDLFEALPGKVKGQYEVLIYTETIFDVKNVSMK